MVSKKYTKLRLISLKNDIILGKVENSHHYLSIFVIKVKIDSVNK